MAAERIPARPVPPAYDDGSLGVETRYLLCLLNVAEELLAMMPPLVQRKYGLIKGTLAVKLGSAAELQPDSAIIASLTSGIQPQVSSSAALPDAGAGLDGGAVPDTPGGAGRDWGGRAAVVRSLHAQFAPEPECNYEPVCSGSPRVPSEARPSEEGAATCGAASEAGVRGSASAPGVQTPGPGPDAARADERALERTMMRHHLRALRACICSVRAAAGDNTGIPASATVRRLASGPEIGEGSAAPVPDNDTAEPEHTVGRDAELEARAQDVAATSVPRDCFPPFPAAAAAPLPDESAAASVTEMLMSCSEALGTLQVAPVRPMRHAPACNCILRAHTLAKGYAPCICVCVYACSCARLTDFGTKSLKCANARTRALTYAHTHTHMRTRTHAHAHARARLHMHSHARTRTHARAQTDAVRDSPRVLQGPH